MKLIMIRLNSTETCNYETILPSRWKLDATKLNKLWSQTVYRNVNHEPELKKLAAEFYLWLLWLITSASCSEKINKMSLAIMSRPKTERMNT